MKGAGPLVRAGGAVALFVLTYFYTPRVLPLGPPQSSVVTMDSAKLVYHQGGTRLNSDEISTDLAGIDPLRVMKETVNLPWDRQEFVRKLNPALIIIHLSAFSDPDDTQADGQEALRSFITYMHNTRTHFLFYSRSLQYDPGQTPSPEKEKEPAAYLAEQTGCAPDKTHVFMFLSGNHPDFRDPVVKVKLCRQVMDFFHL